MDTPPDLTVPGPPPPMAVRMGVYTPAGPPKLILPADPTRLALLVTNSVFNTSLKVSLRTAGVGGWAFVVVPGSYIEITYQRHGDIVYEALWDTGNSVGGTVSWVTLSRF